MTDVNVDADEEVAGDEDETGDDAGAGEETGAEVEDDVWWVPVAKPRAKPTSSTKTTDATT